MKLNKFLVQAKINTYASKNDNSGKLLDDGSKELVFKLDNLMYRDRYHGFNPFIGKEVIFKNNKVIWAMGYYGKIISNIVSADQIYKFLRKAMKLIKQDRPFRGPNNFIDGDFEYIDKSKGTIKDFSGIEIINYKGKKVYKLNYFGGFVNPAP